VRCGKIPGTHTVLFDSDADTIKLTHCARNREGFARGTLKAAQWIHGRRGLYTFEDFLEQILKETIS
jgi:4-hydroxy-tetrahydrodipicolinate reductase